MTKKRKLKYNPDREYQSCQAASQPARRPSPFKGAIIDSQGREIPITERMIQEACLSLEAAASSIYSNITNAKVVPLRD